MPNIADVLKTEFDEDFIKLMRNRMVVSFFKYGPLKDAYPDKVDAIETLKDRIDKYKADGNIEWLVDAAPA